MALNYNDWMTNAARHKENLDDAIAARDAKRILAYRGRYLFALKEAYKLNPAGLVPPAVRRMSTAVPLVNEIKTELHNHQRHIDVSIRENKRTSGINNPTISTELGLKIRRLATYVSQANFATSAAEKKNVKTNIVGSSFSLGGSVVKAPIMASAKIISKLGPLAITICLLPFTALAFGLKTTIDISNGTVTDVDDYKNTTISQLSTSLKKAVKSLSSSIYATVGKI